MVLTTPLKRMEQQMLRQASPARSAFPPRLYHSLSLIPLIPAVGLSLSE